MDEKDRFYVKLSDGTDDSSIAVNLAIIVTQTGEEFGAGKVFTVSGGAVGLMVALKHDDKRALCRVDEVAKWLAAEGLDGGWSAVLMADAFGMPDSEVPTATRPYKLEN